VSGDHLVNVVLDARDVLIGDLEARTAGRFDVDNELARIRAGKVCRTYERKNYSKDHDDADGDPCHGSAGPRQGARHPTFVEIQELLESLVELCKEPTEEGTRMFWIVLFLLLDVFEVDESCTIQRYHRHGKNVRGKN
jgi:hypothetical protein